MKEKEHSLGCKLLGLFVAEEGVEPAVEAPELLEEEPAPGPAVAPPRAVSPAVRAAAPAGRAGPTPLAAAGCEDPLLSADFDALYAKICEDGDPSAEAILTAYGEMSKTLADKVLVTAMNSMIKGIRADVASVRDTLSKRYSMLQNVADYEKKYFSSQRTTRAKELDEKRIATQAQVQELQRQIAELTEELSRTEAGIQQADAEDMGTAEAFNQRVGAEFSRLSALAQFLDSISPTIRG
jgi:hypothetical protein